MDIEILKNKIDDESISTDEKIELIKKLIDSEDPKVREFLDSLLKSKNIRIRYFARKVIREDVGLAETEEKVVWKDKTEEKVKKIIENEDKKTENSSEIVKNIKSTFNFQKALLIAIIILIIVVVITGIYIFKIMNKAEEPNSGNHVQDEKYTTFVLNSDSNQGKDNIMIMRESVKAYYENGEYFDAYLQQVTLFNYLKGKVNKDDYKNLVQCLEKLSWEFLKENKKNGENYLNGELRNTFGFVYQVYSAIHENKLDEKKLAAFLNKKPEILFFLSSGIIREVNSKSDNFKIPSKKFTLKFVYLLYSKKIKQARACLEKITDDEVCELLHKVLKIYSKSSSTEDRKKKFVVPKEFLDSMQAFKNMNIEKACILYIKAMTTDIRVVRLDEQGLLYKVSTDFSRINFFDISDNSKILLISGFSHMILGNMEKASKRLKKVQPVEYKILAVKLLKMFPKKKLLKILLSLTREKSISTETETKVSSNVSSGSSDLKKNLENKKNKLIKAGKFDDAIDVLKQMAKLDPTESKPYIELGEVYLKNGQKGDAIDAFEEGLKREPDLSEVRVKLAEMCFNNGELKKAKVHYGLTLFYETDSEVIDNCQKKILELEKLKKNK